MPNRRKNKNKSKKQGKELSPSAAVYRGRIIVGSDTSGNDCRTITLHSSYTVTSTGGGVINLVMSNDVSGCSDWAEFVDIYREFRCLGLRVEFMPYNRYSKTTTVCTPLITVLDRTNTTPLTSYSLAMAYASAKKHSIEDPWSREIKMSGIEDADFQLTASPAETFSIKIYADGLSLSTVYGRFFIYMCVQFRGRA